MDGFISTVLEQATHSGRNKGIFLKKSKWPHFNLICFEYVLKNLIFDPYWPPKCDPMACPAVTTKIPFSILYIYHYWVYVQNVKIFKIDFVIEI